MHYEKFNLFQLYLLNSALKSQSNISIKAANRLTVGFCLPLSIFEYEYIESNIAAAEKVVFLATIEDIMKCRQKYYFQAGFHTARELLMK